MRTQVGRVLTARQCCGTMMEPQHLEEADMKICMHCGMDERIAFEFDCIDVLCGCGDKIGLCPELSFEAKHEFVEQVVPTHEMKETRQ